jgi:site-specific recombinase XerD
MIMALINSYREGGIMSSKALVSGDQGAKIIRMVLDTLGSDHSQRAYRRALADFMTWYKETGQTKLSKATVQRYTRELQAQGLGAASINQRLSAIRGLGREAADNGAITDAMSNGIARVRGVRQEGQRSGNWLTKEQAQDLLNAPDVASLKGLRDQAILAVLIGTGLRRAEAAGLTFEHIQQREGRWVIVDLVGKGEKVRTVPIPSWAKVALDRWVEAAGINAGRVFSPINKGGRIVGEGMTAQAVRDVAVSYARALGLTVAAHDLRRTFAKLAHKGGAALEQIQLSLGHASLKTTERYLGIRQDLTDAPCDHLGLRLETTDTRPVSNA